MSLPRVLVLADVRGWAWCRKAQALQRCLAGRIDVEVAYHTDHSAGPRIRERAHDLYHSFEVIQVNHFPPGLPFVTGITAHVITGYENRGAGTVKRWADRAVGVHANSAMLQREFSAHLGGRQVYYVPNGVDEGFFRRLRPRSSSSRLVVGHVARPNARKGHDVVREACARVGVELRQIDRTFRNALDQAAMREFYQDLHVLVVHSSMDGTPNPALEAAACEVAIVSNAIGNMPQFLEHGVNGLLTDHALDGLTAELANLAARPRDEVEEMGRAARRAIEADWTWAKRAENYADMWTECIAKLRQAA